MPMSMGPMNKSVGFVQSSAAIDRALLQLHSSIRANSRNGSISHGDGTINTVLSILLLLKLLLLLLLLLLLDPEVGPQALPTLFILLLLLFF